MQRFAGPAFPVAAALLMVPVVNLPLFWEGFSGPPMLATLFVAAMPPALLSGVWPGLTKRHVLWTAPVAFGLALAGALAIGPVGAALGYGFRPELAPLDPGYLGGHHPVWRACLWVLPVQGSISLLLIVGLWMKARNRSLLVRRTASDREEIERIYELLPNSPLAGLSLFRIQELLAGSRSYSAELHGRLLGVLPMFVMERELVGLEPVAESEEIATRLLASLTRRPEYRYADGATIVLRAANGRSEQLLSAGYRPLPETDPELDHVVRVRKFLAGLAESKRIDVDFFSEWKAFYRRPVKAGKLD